MRVLRNMTYRANKVIFNLLQYLMLLIPDPLFLMHLVPLRRCLTARDTSRASSNRVSAKVDYNTVTNVPLLLEPSQCIIKGVTQLVTNEVGFQVVLLDSKCYPILDGEASGKVAFWKSTRKILAALKSLYEQLVGETADLMKAARDAESVKTTDLQDDDNEVQEIQTPPFKKKKLDHCNDAIIATILEKVSSIESKLVFLNDVEQGFHCINCKGVANSPIVSACCQKVVGLTAGIAVALDVHYIVQKMLFETSLFLRGLVKH